jgi:Protein of unknown function (DUF1592)/Protein of unknown function (DUF1588)/Protein of unknown function (DUF1595)/Protein of unknown function (DUF1587)/Protein of unknown function (DUF1585)
MRSGSGRLVLVGLVALAFGGCTGAISSVGTGPGPASSGGAGTSGPPAAGGAGTSGAQTPGSPPGTVGSLPPGTTMTMTSACASAPLAHAGAYVRRLARWEYANTVTDTLKVAMTPATIDLLPADIRANGFANDTGGQLVSLDHATGYQLTADAVGAALAGAPNWLAPFATCTNTTAVCRDQVVKALGLRLFRRPVTATEVTTFGALFDTAVAAGFPTTAGAAVVVVRAMLQSPQFLYRLESQAPPAAGAAARPLDNYEIASRLSYFLWSSAPDDALLAAAQAATLTSPDMLKAQVARMLAAPRAREVIQRYFREWLSLDDLDDANRGATFTPQLAADMKRETMDVVADQLWDSAQPLLSMFTTKTTTVTPAMAKYYGLGAPGAAGRTATDAIPGRQGILTHAGVLTVNGDANASIVLRGLYMLRKVLCQDVPAPPPGATSVMLAPETASERQKSDARLMHEPCKTCHGNFDPLAYAFEPYDAMGAWQTKDTNGNAVRQDGWLTSNATTPGAANVPYTGLPDYMTALTHDQRVNDCLATKAAQFAWGRAMDTGDQCMLEDVRARMNAAKTQTFADLVSAVASSPYFVYTGVQ